MYNRFKNIIHNITAAPVGIAPLITFRILFGGLMMMGAIRFVMNGWIERLYVEPHFFFKFYGFEWVEPFGQTGMYLLLSLIVLSAAMVMVGLFYRFAILTFFLSFSYLELMDATNYLNHYYLVCLLAFLLIFLPANRDYSLDVLRKPSLKLSKVPAWTINILIFQIALVYCCAGLAKLNSDWLLHAMPLAVWLPEHQDLPVLGYFFQFKWTAYLMSWAGACYDLTIAFFLLNSRSRPFAFAAVILFHGLTWLLFNIGLFPFIMIFSTLIFFPASYHERWLGWLGYEKTFSERTFIYPKGRYLIQSVLITFLLVQMLLPFRHFLYPGNMLWTEEGYRFSWRVMLVEKSGQAVFHVEDLESQRKTEVVNGQYLTQYQEKQMSIQPDFILQFAHFLQKEYQQKHGIANPQVTVEAHVALNGRTSQPLIDPTLNLAAVTDGLLPKKWILPFEK